MDPDAVRYLRSIAAGALAEARQIRDLIGDRHWLTDGRHKESLLQAVIRRHLPAGTLACGGFVVHPSERDVCSREQDILVLDTSREAPLFVGDGIAVAFPHTVLAAISVKTRFRRDELHDSCDALNSVLTVASKALTRDNIWCGGYFFEDPSVPLDAESLQKLATKVLESVPRPPENLASREGECQLGFTAIATGERLFMRASYVRSPASADVAVYDCDGLSSALFVSHLIDHIAGRRGAHESGVASYADAVFAGPPLQTARVTLPNQSSSGLN